MHCRIFYWSLLACTLLACGQDPTPPETTPPKPAVAPSNPPSPGLPGTVPLRHDLPQLTITPGESLAYAIELEPGQTLIVAAHQLDVDIALTLFGPRNELLLEVDHPSGPVGAEDLAWTATDTGTHTLAVARPASAGDVSTKAAELDWSVETGEGPGHQLATAMKSYSEAETLRRSREDTALDGYHETLALIPAAEPGLDAPRHERAMRWLHARTLRRLGQLSYARSDLGAATRAFEAALPLLRPDGSGWELAALLNDAGIAYRLAGSPYLARQRFEEALALAQSLGHTGAATSALNNLGVLHEGLGDPEEALAYYARALEGWESLGLDRQAATTQHNLGVTFVTLGLLDEARTELDRALTLRRAFDDPSGEATTLTAIGWAQALEKEPNAALASYDQALELHREAGDTRGETATLDRRALALYELGRPREALQDLHAALELLHGSNNKVSEAHVRANLGALQFELGRERQARASLRLAQELFQAIDDRQGTALVLATLAYFKASRGQPAEAIELYEEALAEIESIRERMTSPSFRQSFLAARYDVVDQLVALHSMLAKQEPTTPHDRLAFELSERERARGLLEGLAGGPGWWQRSDPEWVEHEQRLRGEIHFKEEMRLELLRRGDPEGQAQALTREVDQLLIDYQRLEGILRESAGGMPRARALGLAEVQESLDPETALLVIHPLRGQPRSRGSSSVAASRAIAWWITAGDFRSFTLLSPDGVDLETLARQARNHLATSNRFGHRGQAETDSRLLADILLEPLSEHLVQHHEGEGQRRLVIVAGGALAAIPFAILPSPLALPGSAQPAPAPRLIEHFELVHLPSISVLPFLRRAAPTPSRLLALLADPVFTDDDPRLDPATQTATLEPPAPAPWPLARQLEHATRGDLETLRRLPWAASEAGAILRLLPERTARLAALGLAAHRDLAIGGELAHYRIVHFATHGWLDDRHPLLSGIVLSRFDRQARRRPAFVRVPEIARLHLPADLVVLSACETARGQTLRGEGVVGMAHAFFQAGARRLVVSHWAVDDQATALLMERFYQGLLEDRLPPAAALRQAQLSLLHQEAWSAPYYWGAFTLQGDWQAIEGLL